MTASSTTAGAARIGARQALGMPAIVLAASYLGFGSLCREAGFGLPLSLASTATGWALPGQLVLVELYAAGASFAAITVAVALTNVRLLPMTLTLLPLVREPAARSWRYYLAAHFVAVTGWAVTMQQAPALPRPQRLPFFIGFAAALWLVTLAATALGFILTSAMPASLSLGLVFLNPLYFMLIFAAELRQRARVLALGCGVVAGPLMHLVDPDWGLLLTGLLAGSLAFVLDTLIADSAGRRR